MPTTARGKRTIFRLRSRHPSRGDAGFSLVEAVITVALVALAAVPLTRIVISTQDAASTLHLRAEAIDLATQQLETVQYQMAHGTQEPLGITTKTLHSGTEPFSLATDVEVLPAGGLSSTLCTAPPGATSSQIYTVRVSAHWGSPGGTSGNSIVEKTLIAPSQASIANSQTGELAVPVYSYGTGTANALEVSTPINITVTGSCTGTACSTDPAPVAPAVTTESENTGSTGCAVFPDLYTGTGWTYTATVTGNPGWVDPNELSDVSTASGGVTITNLDVQAGVVTQVSVGAPTLAVGALVTVAFKEESGTAKPADFLPITVANVDACGASGSAAGFCVMGNAATAFSGQGGQQALLFPFASAGADNYQVWSGDQADSNPTDPSGIYPASTAPAVLDATAGANELTVSVPVYPLVLKVSGAPAGTALTATDVGGGATIPLNALSSGTSQTGMPLGQFIVGATSGTSMLSVSPDYVWVTPTGICTSTTVMATPCPTPASSGTVTA